MVAQPSESQAKEAPTPPNATTDATQATDLTYQHQAEQVKQAKARERAARTRKGGVFLIYTGKGKGKTSAALGLMTRAVGHGQRVAMVQFVKGRWVSGERRFWVRYAKEHPQRVRWLTMGEGFSWTTQDRTRDRQAAEATWATAMTWLQDSTLDLVVLDELNIVLRQDLLDVTQVKAAIQGRPATQTVVITGRDAPEALAAMADTLCVIDSPHHHSTKGYGAQRGVEF